MIINPTRLAGGLGAGALALTALAFTAADANAASAGTDWTDGNSRFTMSVSDSTPKVGDVVTVRSTFQRKWSDEYIYQVKHVVPSCFDYVDGSATWDAGKANNVENGSGQNPGYAKITSPNSTSWRVPGLGAGWGSARAVSMKHPRFDAASFLVRKDDNHAQEDRSGDQGPWPEVDGGAREGVPVADGSR